MRYKELISLMNRRKGMIDLHKIYKPSDWSSKDLSEKNKEDNMTNYISNEAFKIEKTKQIKPQIRPANCTVQ